MRSITSLLLFCSIAIGFTTRGESADKEQQIQKLAKDLKNKDYRVRLKAVEELGKHGADSAIVAKEICDALGDSNQKVSLAAFKTLETARPDLYKGVSKILLDATEQKRTEGMKDLGRLEAEAKPATNFIVSWLQVASGQERNTETLDTTETAAYASLRRIGYDEPEIIKALKLLAGPSCKSVAHRDAAMLLLIAWADTDDKRRKELLPLVKSAFEVPRLQLGAIRLTGEYGELCKDFLPALNKLKLSSNATIRDAATKSIMQIEGK